MNNVEKITSLEKQSNDKKIEQATLKERLKTLKEEKNKTLDRLKELDIDTEDLEGEKDNLTNEMNKDVQKCEEILK